MIFAEAPHAMSPAVCPCWNLISVCNRIHSMSCILMLGAVVPQLPLCIVVTSQKQRSIGTVGCLSFHPKAQCVVHALKGLACR